MTPEIPKIDINKMIKNLTVESHLPIAQEKVASGDESAGDCARFWAQKGMLFMTADYLSLAKDINDAEKADILAIAYENKAQMLRVLATGTFAQRPEVSESYLSEEANYLEIAKVLHELANKTSNP